MTTTYEIDVTLSNQTVSTLKDGGFALYAFKAVKSSVAGGAPLVWFRTTSFMTTTAITWQEQYQAYISVNEIIANGMITASASCDIDLGQTAQVSANGDMTPVSTGAAGAVSIFNMGDNPWTTGVSQYGNDRPGPLCAFPLYGNMLDVIVPVERVLLMFASDTVNTGTVIYKAYASGLMVDLTASPTRQATFDINTGWSWSGAWGQGVQPNANLVPLLITPS